MANIIGAGEMPQPPMGKPKLDISTSTPMACECGYDKFIPTVKVRKVSKFTFGGSHDIVVPFDVMICGSCGVEQEELKPMELRALEAKDKMEAESKKVSE